MFLVFLHVLNVSFGQRVILLDVVDEGMFSRDHLVDHSVEGDWREDSKVRMFGHAVVGVDTYCGVVPAYCRLAQCGGHGERGADLASFDGHAGWDPGRGHWVCRKGDFDVFCGGAREGDSSFNRASACGAASRKADGVKAAGRLTGGWKGEARPEY